MSSFVEWRAFSMFSSLSILTVADDGCKQRYINNENWSDQKTWIPENIYIYFPKNNCEKQITSTHKTFPCCYSEYSILHPWEIWLDAFRIYHICKIKHILSKYMISIFIVSIYHICIDNLGLWPVHSKVCSTCT